MKIKYIHNNTLVPKNEFLQIHKACFSSMNQAYSCANAAIQQFYNIERNEKKYSYLIYFDSLGSFLDLSYWEIHWYFVEYKGIIYSYNITRVTSN